MRRLFFAALFLALAVVPLDAAAAGSPSAYAPVVIEAGGAPGQAQFDLSSVLERARRENKRVYVYLGAHDCGYCRKYEAFLAQNATALKPHFAAKYIVADLRSSLAVPAKHVYIKVGTNSLPTSTSRSRSAMSAPACSSIRMSGCSTPTPSR